VKSSVAETYFASRGQNVFRRQYIFSYYQQLA